MKTRYTYLLAAWFLLLAAPLLAQRTRPVIDDAATLAELLHKDYSGIQDPIVRMDQEAKDRKMVIAILNQYFKGKPKNNIFVSQNNQEIRSIIDNIYGKIVEGTSAISSLEEYNIRKDKENQERLEYKIELQGNKFIREFQKGEIDQLKKTKERLEAEIRNNKSKIDSLKKPKEKSGTIDATTDSKSKEEITYLTETNTLNQNKISSYDSLMTTVRKDSTKIDSSIKFIEKKLKSIYNTNNNLNNIDKINIEIVNQIKKLKELMNEQIKYNLQNPKETTYRESEIDSTKIIIVKLKKEESNLKLSLSAGATKNVALLSYLQELSAVSDSYLQRLILHNDTTIISNFKLNNNIIFQKYIKNYVAKFKYEHQNNQSHGSFSNSFTQKSSLAAGASGTLKLLIDALSQEIVERIETELALTVMAEVRRALDPDNAADPRARTTLLAIGVLLPQTLRFLRTPQQPQSPETLLHALREKVSLDVRDLPINVGQLHTVPAIRSELNNPRIALLYEGVRTLITMSKCTQPYQWLDALADIRPGRWASVSTGMENAMALLQAVAFVSNSLLVSENGELVYVKSAYLHTLLANDDSRNLFLGLAYENLKKDGNYPQFNSIVKTKLMLLDSIVKGSSNGSNHARVQISKMTNLYLACAKGVDELNDLANQLAERRRAGDPIDPATAVQYYRSLVDWADTLYHNVAQTGPLPQYYFASNEVSRFFTGARQLGMIYQEVLEKKYVAAVGSSLEFVKLLDLTSTESMTKLEKYYKIVKHFEAIRELLIKINTLPSKPGLLDTLRQYQDVKPSINDLLNFVHITGDTITVEYAQKCQKLLNDSKTKFKNFINFLSNRGIQDSLTNKLNLYVDSLTLSVDILVKSRELENFSGHLTSPQQLQKAFKYIRFISSVVEAKDAKEMRAALRTVAEPAGSSTIKKESSVYGYIGAYPQFFFGGETVEGKTSLATGFSVPFGIGISSANKREDRTKPASAWTFFFSILDLASPVSWRFDNKNEDQLPDFELVQLFSPGAMIYWDLPRIPVSIGGGISYRPRLRRFDTNGAVTQEGAVRFSFGIAMDLPLFRLWRKER